MNHRIQVRADIDTRLPDYLVRQLPHVMRLGINRTLQEAQEAQRAEMARRFTLRRRQWARSAVKITQFARRDQLEGELRIVTPGDPSRTDILTQHERTGRKRPRSGRSIAIPEEGSPVLKTRRSVVRKQDRPRELLSQASSGGRRTVFVRETPDGKRAIFQVITKGRNQHTKRGRPKKSSTSKRRVVRTLKLLYRLKPSVPLDGRLNFHATTVALAERRLDPIIAEELAKVARQGPGRPSGRGRR